VEVGAALSWEDKEQPQSAQSEAGNPVRTAGAQENANQVLLFRRASLSKDFYCVEKRDGDELRLAEKPGAPLGASAVPALGMLRGGVAVVPSCSRARGPVPRRKPVSGPESPGPRVGTATLRHRPAPHPRAAA